MKSRKDLVELLISQKAVGFFDPPVVLKSGITSSWYVNWRRISDTVASAKAAAEFIARKVVSENFSPDSICGVPEGTTKLATLATCALEEITKKPKVLLMGRGKPKEHGAPSDRFFIGPTDISAVALEDVVTSGGSLVEFLDRCRQSNVKIMAAISLTDRQARSEREKLTKRLQDLGVRYMPLLLAKEILPLAIDLLKPPAELKKKVEEELGQLEES